MDLLGALVVAVSKAGGQPTVEVSIPEANKRAVMETPIEHLKLTPTYGLMQSRVVDCFISTGSTQNPQLFADVPEDRMAALRQASQPLNEAFKRVHFRSLSLGQTGGIPTKAYAASKGADYQELLAMFWSALDANYQQMKSTGEFIATQFKPGSRIKLTSKAGTDITFQVANIPARINCGQSSENISASGPAQVWLPAGETYACTDPVSASGIVVVPTMSFRGHEIKNLKLTFKNGKITNLKADQNGAILQESLDMSTGEKDALSLVDVGLNPNCHPLKGSEYYSWEMAGMVSIGTGNNSWAGGNVESDIGLSFHLANATLSVDGKMIVDNGQLTTGSMTAK
jgi:leucyl aminopeptidase (aminopeptidase T)